MESFGRRPSQVGSGEPSSIGDCAVASVQEIIVNSSGLHRGISTYKADSSQFRLGQPEGSGQFSDLTIGAGCVEAEKHNLGFRKKRERESMQ